MNLTERLKGNLTEYKSIPFWSWNDHLEPEELRRQIREMKKAGIGGFFMHARGGLSTEYMSDEWFDDVAACVDEAQKQGMNAWAYDENGWPSGFAGMKLLKNPDNFAHYLTCEARPNYDPDALGCYRVEEGRLIRVLRDEGESCVCVYDKTNNSVVDILNRRIVREFIDETHEKYYNRFKHSFGKVLLGFFTDEPQYFRYETAYSPVIRQKYKELYGEELIEELGALFIDCDQSNRFRYRYWKLMNDTYTESFMGQIYRWCQDHGCQLTGHTIDENGLFGQLMCSGGVMPFYQYEHIPGIDWLGRRIGSELAPKQVASVAQQLGRKHVLTETFACCGWDVTPRELKRIAEWQYVNGVNLMCQHLYPYSIRGQRKRDYPAFYSNHNPWTKDFLAFNDYFTTLGYLLSESREVANVLVIHPIHSAYFDFKRDDASTLRELNDRFTALIEKLGARGIGHHFADETLMAKYGSVQEDRIVIGECAYSCVVVPDMKGLDRTTVQMLREYVSNGGQIWFAGEKVPYLVDGEREDIGLQSNISFDDIQNPGVSLDRDDTMLRMTIRHSEFGDFIYAVNLAESDRADVRMHVNARGAKAFNLEKREFEKIFFEESASGGIDIPLNLEAGESRVIFLSADQQGTEKPVQKQMKTINAPDAFILQTDENALTIDRCALSYDNEIFTEPMPVMAVSDRLLRERTNRTIYLKYVFDVSAKPDSLRIEAEKMNAECVWLNGETLQLTGKGTQDPAFLTADVTGRVRLGQNEIVFMVNYHQSEHIYNVFNGVYYDHDGTTESLVNCLSYETDIEDVYLRGSFCVDGCTYEKGEKNTFLTDGPFRVTLPRKYVTLNSLAQDGFPFFAGTIKVSLPFTAKGDETRLRLNGRFSTARVTINGGQTHLLMFSTLCDIAGELRKGKNIMEIELVTSCRNLYGPFHNPNDPESYSVSPQSFALYGTWNDGKSKNYTNRYAFTAFGIDSIEIG